MAVTTYGEKPFTWSYSALTGFENCPKQLYHLKILKDVADKDDANDNRSDGLKLHDALAKRIAKGTPLPPQYAFYEKYALKVLEGSPGDIFCEQKYALNRNFGACSGYFAPDVWYRGVADVVKVADNIAVAIDWKTGKIIEDSVQLGLMAACVFAHFPDVKFVRTKYIWFKDNAETTEDWTRETIVSMWNNVLPRVAAYEHAFKTTSFPAVENGLCARYCPVFKCPHNGRTGP